MSGGRDPRNDTRRAPDGAPVASARDGAVLAGAWVITALAVALVSWRYPALPALVPAWRTPAGDHLVEKGVLVVLRAPLIGAACLAVVHTMLGASPTGGWRAFWRVGAACVAVKTFAEAVEIGLLGVGAASASTLARAVPLVAVLAFVITGLRLWRRGALPLSGAGAPGWAALGGREQAVLVGAGLAWAVLASAPAWMG